jgi:hypothetical protein
VIISGGLLPPPGDLCHGKANGFNQLSDGKHEIKLKQEFVKYMNLIVVECISRNGGSLLGSGGFLIFSC